MQLTNLFKVPLPAKIVTPFWSCLLLICLETGSNQTNPHQLNHSRKFFIEILPLLWGNGRLLWYHINWKHKYFGQDEKRGILGREFARARAHTGGFFRWRQGSRYWSICYVSAVEILALQYGFFSKHRLIQFDIGRYMAVWPISLIPIPIPRFKTLVWVYVGSFT